MTKSINFFDCISFEDSHSCFDNFVEKILYLGGKAVHQVKSSQILSSEPKKSTLRRRLLAIGQIVLLTLFSPFTLALLARRQWRRRTFRLFLLTKFCQRIGESWKRMQRFLIMPTATNVLLWQPQPNMSAQKEYQTIDALRRPLNSNLIDYQKGKDRYPDVRVYKNNRICFLGPDKKVTHINASPYLGEKESFILTQGPLPNTLPDFFSMLWMVNTKALLALTNPTEKGKEKCQNYWEVGEHFYGTLKVDVKAAESLVTDSSVTLWKRSIELSKNSQVKTMVHYWVENWPDNGVVSRTILQRLCVEVEKLEGNKGAICLHCSAGLGRSGVVTVLLEGRARRANKKPVNIPQIVLDLNAARLGCIINSQQYLGVRQFFEKELDVV